MTEKSTDPERSLCFGIKDQLGRSFTDLMNMMSPASQALKKSIRTLWMSPPQKPVSMRLIRRVWY